MATQASLIPKPISSCNEFLNAGSSIFVALLDNCAEEPTEITVAIDAVGLIGDETIDLTVTGVTEFTFRQGYIIPFTEGDVVVTSETTVTATATTVPVEPLTFAPAGTETIIVWNIYKMVSPTNIPINISKTIVDRTDLSSPQKGDATTSRMTDSSVTAISTPDDVGLWQHVLLSADSEQNLFAVVVKTSQQVLFGEALTENYTVDSPIDEIERPNFNLKFQRDNYRNVTRWPYATTLEQGVVNTVLQRCGMPVYS